MNLSASVPAAAPVRPSARRSIMFEPSMRRLIPVLPRAASATPPAAMAPATPAPRPTGPDLEAVRREAFAAGEAKGQAQAAALAQQQQQRWQQLDTQLESYFDNLERALNARTIELAVKLAEIIVRHRLPDEEMLRALVRDVMARIPDMHGVKIRLHPEDVHRLAAPAELADPALADGRITWLADATLKPGDMVVENGFGYYDARLAQRLDMLRDQMLERFGKTDVDGRAI